MPIYEYVCDACGWTEEPYRPMKNASDPFMCPACSQPARRIYSVPAFTDRPTSPAILRDPIAKGIPRSHFKV